MKKTLKVLLFLLGISVVAQAETVPTEMNEADKKEAIKILNRMRDKIEKAEKERAKEEARLAKEKAEAEKKAQEETERIAKEQAVEAERQAMEAQKKVAETVQAVGTTEIVPEVAPVEEKAAIEEIKPETEEQRIERINKTIAEKRKAEKKAKTKTAFEKLEKTKEEALTKLDFYERVVRSVAREEKEIKEYTEITEGK